jgi:hypothetical protein
MIKTNQISQSGNAPYLYFGHSRFKILVGTTEVISFMVFLSPSSLLPGQYLRPWPFPETMYVLHSQKHPQHVLPIFPVTGKIWCYPTVQRNTFLHSNLPRTAPSQEFIIPISGSNSTNPLCVGGMHEHTPTYLISIMTKLYGGWLKNLIPGGGQGFPPHCRHQTEFKAHPASYPMATRVPFQRRKVASWSWSPISS